MSAYPHLEKINATHYMTQRGTSCDRETDSAAMRPASDLFTPGKTQLRANAAQGSLMWKKSVTLSKTGLESSLGDPRSLPSQIRAGTGEQDFLRQSCVPILGFVE
ncbi:hypothetical protein MATL_G00179890 [Megalops atlanticus]|uniref:Uncharacterized protein n=1 Tax=Megalops atlanticus TaxID=7932 RepID=A0A9D3PPJ5_MEGAT|nr:hypothetical protein MATL_G00179890 [Megalops atlanticus]